MNTYNEAISIIEEVTSIALNGYVVHPMDDDEVFDHMTEECGCVLTHRWLEGKYTPMQYINIRNDLIDIIAELFKQMLK